jgi:hypothetical protein
MSGQKRTPEIQYSEMSAYQKHSFTFVYCRLQNLQSMESYTRKQCIYGAQPSVSGLNDSDPSGFENLLREPRSLFGAEIWKTKFNILSGDSRPPSTNALKKIPDQSTQPKLVTYG